MVCHQLIYISRPTVEVTQDVLLDILNKAQTINHKFKISGLLIFHNGKFMQLLEGGEKEVKDLFEKIQHDPRHSDVRILLETDRPNRCMPLWTMGFSMSGSVDNGLSNQGFYIAIDETRQLCEKMEADVGQKFLQLLGE